LADEPRLTAAAWVLTAPFVAALEPGALTLAAGEGIRNGVESPPPPQPVIEATTNSPANHILLLNLFRISYLLFNQVQTSWLVTGRESQLACRKKTADYVGARCRKSDVNCFMTLSETVKSVKIGHHMQHYRHI
jgi:hypothetical protein